MDDGQRPSLGTRVYECPTTRLNRLVVARTTLGPGASLSRSLQELPLQRDENPGSHPGLNVVLAAAREASPE
jgi:hypothetical protein